MIECANLLLTNWLFFEKSKWKKDILSRNYCRVRHNNNTILSFHYEKHFKNFWSMFNELENTCILASWAIATCKRAFHTMLLVNCIFDYYCRYYNCTWWLWEVLLELVAHLLILVTSPCQFPSNPIHLVTKDGTGEFHRRIIRLSEWISFTG